MLMETANFHGIITFLIFLCFQTYGTSSIIDTMTNKPSSNATCIQTERQALLVFRKGLTDVSNRLSTWTGVECCEWHGVGCDGRNGHVVKLDLRSPLFFIRDYMSGDTLNTSNWLRGEVSHALLNLKHLRYLDLSMNNFSEQSIPEFLGSFKRLEYLNLSHSGFNGVVPPHLGNLSKLQYLDLNNYKVLDRYGLSLGVYSSFGNYLFVRDALWWVSSLSSLKHLDLSGINIGNHTDWFHPVNMLPSLLTLNLASCHINNIPNSVESINFTSLTSLDLSLNNINFTIPLWISNLTGLMHLNLRENSFHGRIPYSIGMLSSLASIDLSRNSFNTSMPDLLWNLSSLVRLDLSNNRFHGSFPADVKLCNLSFLDLSVNELVGDLSSIIMYISSDCLRNSLKDLALGSNNFNGRIPNKIGEFKKLENLILTENELSGPIPESIGLLSRLQWLDISDNQLNGSIPASIGLLTRLITLDLDANQLSGNIPTSLGQLSNLEDLNVMYNSLDGVLSEIHFTKLNTLTYLSLSGNSLTLNIRSGWIPPFQLKFLYADFCNTGPRFPNWLRTQVNLELLYLSNSNIRDTIPEWFENISSHINDLDLSHNQIGGNLPRFHGYSSSGRFLRLSSNRFEGSFTSFPSNVKVLDLSDNLLSGRVPHIDGTKNPDLEVVNLANNQFTGSVPAHLCKVLTIRVLDLSNNNFFGRLPGCLGNLIDLVVMDLSNNTITGVVPNTLGSLAKLKSLHLRNNKLEGVLSVSLQNLTELVTLDLGDNSFKGNIPFWIGQKLPQLRLLNLQLNKFSSNIPLQLCQLKEIQYLNLATNNINGTIPHCFQNLRGMIIARSDSDYEFNLDPYYEENIYASMKGNQLLYTRTIKFLTSLDLSNNEIIGEIPNVLMNLVGLKNLNFSRNLLKGEIPTMIGNLKQMESLDLSMNKLSGGIPQSLTNLNFLSYLNLSFNNLSGPIPTGNQLRTLDDPFAIYKGNNGLCGPPLSRSCKGNKVLYTREGKHDTEDLWFYTGIGTGFVVGFMGLIASLYFIRIWRVVYFETIKNVYTWLTILVPVILSRPRRPFSNEVLS